jgi:diguanylate cyclase (GGDEF)-like protein/PAS domain S-box-containing protein
MFSWLKLRRLKQKQRSTRAATEATLENSRDRVFRTLIENASDIITILAADGTIEYESPSVKRILGFNPEEMVGKNAFEFVHPDDLPTVQAQFHKVIGVVATGNEVEFRYRQKDGGWRYLELTGTNLLQDATVEGIVVNSRDVTQRRMAEHSLRESEERYALAMRGANDGLWDWDLVRNQLYVSPRWKAMLGFSEEEPTDARLLWLDRVHPDDRDRLETELKAHVEGTTPHFESEYRILHKQGDHRYMLSRALAVRDQNGRALRMAGSQTDITDRKRAEEQLIHGALHDVLTGLPNRALFLDRLQRAMARAQRRKDYKFAVIFMDLDRFKVVNDSLGHSLGDQLLIEVGRVLEKCIRPEDTVARLGGDEFTILVEDLLDPSQAEGIAQRIHDHLQAPFMINGREVFTTASIGIALNAPNYTSPEDFIRDSDIAMYKAKSLGKARSELFNSSMHVSIMNMLDLETELRHAVERDEIEVWYQCIVDVATAKIVGFEGLARWQNPKRGLISPMDFIPIAEETGLIVPISLCVLRSACKQLSKWHKELNAPELSMSVNISGRHFTQPDLVEQVMAAVHDNNLAPSQLRLEITESVVIGDMEKTERILKSLRAMGIKVYLDDFGTGYSSLSYLIRLPIDTLKIDRSFITGIETKQARSDVVATIIKLAKNLGMNVVAEGIETTAQFEQISLLDCDQVQGFLFSKPVPAASATQLLKDEAVRNTFAIPITAKAKAYAASMAIS